MVTRSKFSRARYSRSRSSADSSRQRRRPTACERPILRFTPYAWSKLLFLQRCGNSEVSGFGVTSKDDPLLVSDVRLVHQQCTTTSVQFLDAHVQEIMTSLQSVGEANADRGCIWIHTHPETPLAK